MSDDETKLELKPIDEYRKRQEAHDKREEDASALYALEINSCISHRGAVEGFLASQVETHKENNRINALNMVMNERLVTAMEQIAHTLTRIANKVEIEP